MLQLFFFGAVVRLMLRPPGYHPKKQRALYGGYMFCWYPPRGGVVPRVWWSAWHRMAQSDAKKCTPGGLALLQSKGPRVTNQALGKAAGSSRKCLRQGGAMRRMRLPFFGGMAG